MYAFNKTATLHHHANKYTHAISIKKTYSTIAHLVSDSKYKQLLMFHSKTLRNKIHNTNVMFAVALS